MMKENDVKCKDVANHICESLGEDLNSEKCTAIKNHLSQCKSCSNYFESVIKTIELFKGYNVTITEEVHNRLLKTLSLDDFC